MSQHDWEKYMFWHIRGIRAYLVKDPLSTVPEGLRLRRRLLVAHYLLIGALNIFFFFILTKIVSFFL
ncbi:hypothetical protein WDU94_007508 [Cyamophila willieti]